MEPSFGCILYFHDVGISYFLQAMEFLKWQKVEFFPLTLFLLFDLCLASKFASLSSKILFLGYLAMYVLLCIIYPHILFFYAILFFTEPSRDKRGWTVFIL